MTQEERRKQSEIQDLLIAQGQWLVRDLLAWEKTVSASALSGPNQRYALAVVAEMAEQAAIYLDARSQC